MFPSARVVRNLSNGQNGIGYLVYYLKSRDPTKASLIVKLVHVKGERSATAYVYQVAGNSGYIPYHVHNGRVFMEKTERPAMVMDSLTGNWIQDGHAALNLDIRIYSPFTAMWEPVKVSSLWTSTSDSAVKKSRPIIYTIQTRTYPNGVPKWDLRQVLPSFTASLLRTNYAQRENDGPVKWTRSISPEWPYVSESGGFLQNYGTEAPPIVMDWITGRIKDFSEVVSVRAESHGYAFYSLNPLRSKKLLAPNFESPWGFYNVSGTPSAFPNLLIRVQHNSANDPFYTSYGGASQFAPLYPYQSEDVRYSWADHPGDLQFNYKVDVDGTVPYTQVVSIAGGRLRVLAPAYQSYPHWVIYHKWAVATFVDTEGHPYDTSEGIYSWPSSAVGLPYVRGWSATPNLSEFNSIFTGFRGEYRLGRAERPELYISPFDGRWHLLNASAGLWNLGNGQILKESNLNGGTYINSWVLLRRKGKRVKQVQQFVHLDGWSMYSGPQGAIWAPDARKQELLNALPPTNHASWVNFKRLSSEYKKHSPMDMKSWMPAGATPIHGLSLGDITSTRHGFKFVLSVIPTDKKGPIRVPGIGLLRGGTYAIQYDGVHQSWTSRRATNAQPLVSKLLFPQFGTALVPQEVKYKVSNNGDLPMNGTLILTVDGRELTKEKVSIGGGEYATLSGQWTPSHAGSDLVEIKLKGKIITRSEVTVRSYIDARTAALWNSMSQQSEDWYLPGLALVIVLGAVYLSWRRLSG